MGWSFDCHDVGRKAYIERLTSQKHFSEGYTPLEHRVVGNHVWQLVRIDDENRTFICLDLIAKERGAGWGHKGMSEDMGPCYYDCPLSLLDKADPPREGSYAAAWREKVREYHARKSAKPQAGMVVKYGGHEYRLDTPAGPRKGWRVTRVSDAMVFRMSSRQLADALA